MRNDGLKLLCLLLLLTGCSATPKRCEPIVQTETVEVEVPVFVPLPDALTAPVAEPAAPVRATRDPAGRLTINNDQSTDWLEQWKAALSEANDKLAQILSRQPKQPGGAP